MADAVLPAFTDLQLTRLREVLGDDLLNVILDPGWDGFRRDESAPLSKYSTASLLNACRGCFLGIKMAHDDARKLEIRWSLITEELVRRESANEPWVAPAAKPRLNLGRPPRPVRCIETGQTFSSAREAEHAMGISGVANAVYHKQKAAGYHFEAIDKA